MRLEINVPDSTRDDVKARLRKLARRLSETPEYVDEIYSEPEIAPAILKEAYEADADISAGQYSTEKRMDAALAERRADWDRKKTA